MKNTTFVQKKAGKKEQEQLMQKTNDHMVDLHQAISTITLDVIVLNKQVKRQKQPYWKPTSDEKV